MSTIVSQSYSDGFFISEEITSKHFNNTVPGQIIRRTLSFLQLHTVAFYDIVL